MTLVFCSLRHCTGPHPVLSAGWLLPLQPPPLSLLPPPPRLPASEPQPSIDKIHSRNRTKGTQSWGRSRRPRKRETPAKTTRCKPLAAWHALAARQQDNMGNGPATISTLLPAQGCDSSPRLQSDSAPSQPACVHFSQRPRCFALDLLSVVRGSPAPALCLSGAAHGVGSALREIHTRNCCAVGSAQSV